MDSRLVVPLTVSHDAASIGASDAILNAAISSPSSVLASSPLSVVNSGASEPLPATICVGCRDGGIFILKVLPFSSTEDPAPSKTSVSEVTSHKSSGPRLSQLASGASTPTTSSRKTSFAHSAPHGLISAPVAAVSNLNAVQVEAPKVFVPHDKEKGKLRAILGQTGQDSKQESSIIDGIARPFEKSIQIDSDSPTRPSIQPTEGGTLKSMKSKLHIHPLSAVSSSSSSPVGSPDSRSRHTSVTGQPSHPYKLHCHILSSQTGPNQEIAAIKYLNNGESILVLQESGSVKWDAMLD